MPDFDAIIIGTGQAGPSLAFRLAGAGMKVAVVERHLVGGTYSRPRYSSGTPALRSPAKYVVSTKARTSDTPQDSATRKRAIAE
jgi:cation diffusion facilitator CzcD-associated flavoprotein CzcO